MYKIVLYEPVPKGIVMNNVTANNVFVYPTEEYGEGQKERGAMQYATLWASMGLHHPPLLT